MTAPADLSVKAEPYPFAFDPPHCALRHHRHAARLPRARRLRRGARQRCRACCAAPSSRTARLLAAWRAAGLLAIHTREGHRPDLADLPPAKNVARPRRHLTIGDNGPMGRILVRGEPGHDIIPELYPAPGEPVIDKPGKGAFFATDLHAILQNRGITQLVVTGVTTEVCVNTTVREANDRGYDCLVLEDCVGSYFPEFQEPGLAMIRAQGGIFGWVGASADLIAAVAPLAIDRRP